MAKKSYLTPPGIAVFPRLNKPDTKFNADGEYNVKLKLEGEAAEELKAKFDALVDEAYEQMKEEHKKFSKVMTKACPYNEELDDEGDPTGAWLFNFKMNAIGKAKNGDTWTNKVRLFDAKGKPTNKLVFGGSEIIVSFRPRPYFNAKDKVAGVTKDLIAVQVLKLVNNETADSYGFEVHDDGFEDTSGEAVSEPSHEGDDEASDSGEGDGDAPRSALDF